MSTATKQPRKRHSCPHCGTGTFRFQGERHCPNCIRFAPATCNPPKLSEWTVVPRRKAPARA